MAATIKRKLRYCDSFHSAFQCPILYGYWWNLAQAAGSVLSLSRILPGRSGSQPLFSTAMCVVFYCNSNATLISTAWYPPHCRGLPYIFCAASSKLGPFPEQYEATATVNQCVVFDVNSRHWVYRV